MTYGSQIKCRWQNDQITIIGRPKNFRRQQIGHFRIRGAANRCNTVIDVEAHWGICRISELSAQLSSFFSYAAFKHATNIDKLLLKAGDWDLIVMPSAKRMIKNTAPTLPPLAKHKIRSRMNLLLYDNLRFSVFIPTETPAWEEKCPYDACASQ